MSKLKNFFFRKSMIHACWIILLLIGVIIYSQINKMIVINKEPSKVYKVPESMKRGNNTATIETSTQKKFVPSNEDKEKSNKETDIDLTKGHWHNGVWHDENHKPVEMTPELMQKLGNRERNSVFNRFDAKNLDPPPKGYKYRLTQAGNLVLDENLNPVLYKIPSPKFRIETRRGFAPTLEQYKRYQKLLSEHRQALESEDFTTADNLQSEIDQLKRVAQGDLPHVTFNITMESPNQSEIDEENQRAEQLSKPILYMEYRKRGLAHLIPEIK